MVVNSILADIFNNVYKPGDRLPSEYQLTEEYGVSRATIREAFKKLNMLNVLSIRQGDGTFVEESNAGILFQPIFSKMIFERKNIEQLYEARVWLEVAALSIALKKITHDDIKKLRVMIVEMDEALQNENSSKFSALDNDMHQYIFKIAGNFVLSSVYGMMRDVFKIFRTRSLKTIPQMKISNKRHHMVLQALEEGDNAAAVELMRRHIEVCKQQTMESLEPTDVTDSDKELKQHDYEEMDG
jgi:GntR family transcriptional repressor for pyruvate dehydrogenase complex